MNEKGLTLVEIIAALVILSIIALIVTPNIYVSIKDYREQLYTTQMNNIRDAGKNWATDHIDDDNFPSDSSFSLKVTLKELQEGGYIDDDLKDTKGSGNFDNTFVLIDCELVTDIGEELASNYKYDYNSYYDMNDYYEKSAIEYAKDNIKDKGTVTVTVEELQNMGYVAKGIKSINNVSTSIDTSKSVNIIASLSEEDTAEMVYTASVQ